MKTSHVIGLSMLSGVALGAVAIQGLHAQAKPPVYAIVEIEEITDPEGYKAITQVANANMPLQGGRYITRTEKITVLDGKPPRRFSVIAFDTPEKATAWYNSPGQNKMTEIRQKTTRARVFLAEGL